MVLPLPSGDSRILLRPIITPTERLAALVSLGSLGATILGVAIWTMLDRRPRRRRAFLAPPPPHPHT
jgi:hypothetical protein